eukprot:COSAG04_NODE_822_length_10053_cov_12.017681_7_plen_59_part_00
MAEQRAISATCVWRFSHEAPSALAAAMANRQRPQQRSSHPHPQQAPLPRLANGSVVGD